MGAGELSNRTLFRAPEVCQVAGIQPYVLRTWEAEFPDLGISPRDGGPRLYRRVDVERVLAIKQLVFEEGLTLAGAKRRLGEAPAPRAAAGDAVPWGELLARDARERLERVREGLRELLASLARPVGGAGGGRAVVDGAGPVAVAVVSESGRVRTAEGRRRRRSASARASRGKRVGRRARR